MGNGVSAMHHHVRKALEMNVLADKPLDASDITVSHQCGQLRLLLQAREGSCVEFFSAFGW
jgi:hypothetical protein